MSEGGKFETEKRRTKCGEKLEGRKWRTGKCRGKVSAFFGMMFEV